MSDNRIYDHKGRVVGYQTKLQPSNENIVIRPQSVTDKINEAEAKEAYERIWKNKLKR